MSIIKYGNSLPEPEHEIVIFKWNVVGKNKLLKHDMWIDGKYKVKIIIGPKHVNVLKINNKHPSFSKDSFNTVKNILKAIYDGKFIIYEPPVEKTKQW